MVINEIPMPPVVLCGEGYELECGSASEAQRIIGQDAFPGNVAKASLIPTPRHIVLLSKLAAQSDLALGRGFLSGTNGSMGSSGGS